MQNSDSIPKQSIPRKAPSDRTLIDAAALAYRTALFDFAEGRIPWATLLERCQTLRKALRERPRQ